MSNSALSSIEHIVVLILENRSFDHMLGLLYSDQGNVSPLGQPFEGLSGNESNPDEGGNPVSVFRVTPRTANAYLMPGTDPGEGYYATNSQLFGQIHAPTEPPAAGTTNHGFVKNFTYTLSWESRESPWNIVPRTASSNIMGIFTPEALPVLSGLAKGYAVCDHWFGSVPTETLPNRAFASAGTSQGHLDDHTKSYTCPTIFGALSKAGVPWSIYGYTQQPLTRHTFSELINAPDKNFGVFTDFQTACQKGTLASYVFLEPSWGTDGNNQHPAADVSLGEKLIYDVYYALKNSPIWEKTLLIITYDEHGGCYDHVTPPANATPPDNAIGEYGFDFTRFGPRVPTVLVSPLIKAGTVFRVGAGDTPFDHTSILKTVEKRFGLAALTARDAAACDVGAALTRKRPRLDDPLVGVTVPTSRKRNPTLGPPSHLQQVYAELVSRLPLPDDPGGGRRQLPELRTGAEAEDYIRRRTAAWLASKRWSR